MKDLPKTAIIVAGGSGSRMESAIPKQYLQLAGKTILHHSIDKFLSAFPEIRIIVVIHPDDRALLAKSLPGDLQNRISIQTGGDSRYASVQNGLSMVENESIVFVHDAVRCLVSVSLIHRCYTTALQYGNAVPAIAASDSMRMLDAAGSTALDRSKIRLIQTPQTFHSHLLKLALAQPYSPAFTDEAGAAEKAGVKINLVEGDNQNIKITYPVDLLIAEQILKTRKEN